MKLLTDISIFLHIATICVSLLLIAVIAGKKAYYRKANLFLILLLLVIVIVHTNASLILSGYKIINVHFQNVQNAFGLLLGPSLYFTTRLRLPEEKDATVNRLHFLPFFLFLMIVSLHYSNVLTANGWALAEGGALIFFLIQLPAYIAYTYFFIRKREVPFFKTLSILLTGLFLLYLVQLLVIGYEVLVHYITNVITLNISLLFSICVIAFAYQCLLNSNLLFDSPKCSASALTPRQANELVNKAKDLMEKEKPFTRPDLKIKDVADRLETSGKYLSQAINDAVGKNFTEFINEYRVDYVKTLLLNPQNEQYTLLAIAQKAGFKSGSTFNKAFKTYTGMLPSEFRKKIKGKK